MRGFPASNHCFASPSALITRYCFAVCDRAKGLRPLDPYKLLKKLDQNLKIFADDSNFSQSRPKSTAERTYFRALIAVISGNRDSNQHKAKPYAVNTKRKA